DRVGEAQHQVGLDVTAPAGRAPAHAATGEDRAEQVGEPAATAAEPAVAGGRRAAGRATTRGAEQVGQVERRAAAAGAAPERARAEQLPHLVVFLAAALVGQHVVGLGHVLEPVLCLAVAGVAVGVELAGQLPVR